MHGVFSGAGISYADPASLPLGRDLRDVVLDVCQRAASTVHPAAVNRARGRGLPSTGWKLEYVLGRLDAAAGPPVLDLLECLRVAVPNEAHMLCAAALARGGVHATVNLDNGIERAYDLLAGHERLPAGTPPHFDRQLHRWRAALAQPLPALHMLVAQDDFDDWRANGSPQPALFKLHGSIATRARGRPVRPVVSDFVEMHPLTATQLVALDATTGARRCLVTGYAGGDADCFAPLLARLRSVSFDWADPYPSPQVTAQVAALRRGQPLVLPAVDALRRDPWLGALPPWPDDDLGARARAAAHTSRWSAGVDAHAAAEAFGWMLIDARHLEAAEQLLAVLWRTTRRRSVLRHLADAFYHDGEHNKRRAAVLYRRLLRPGPSPPGFRTYALTRYGSAHRALAQGRAGRKSVARAVVAPALAWLLSWPDRAGPAGRASALGALAHFGLRVLEAQLAVGHRSPRERMLGFLVNVALRRSGRAADAHGYIYNRLQQAELAALRLLAARRPDPVAAQRSLAEIAAVEQVYSDMGIEMGVANAAGARALADAAAGRPAQARADLDEALARYRTVTGLDPSGTALVDRRRRLVDRLP